MEYRVFVAVTGTLPDVAWRWRVYPDLFFPCVLGHAERLWRGRLSASVAFRKPGLPFTSSTGRGKLLLLMNKSISMMMMGCFTASTFSSVESLRHLILAPL
jgi:hypothetical protein